MNGSHSLPWEPLTDWWEVGRRECLPWEQAYALAERGPWFMHLQGAEPPSYRTCLAGAL